MSEKKIQVPLRARIVQGLRECGLHEIPHLTKDQKAAMDQCESKVLTSHGYCSDRKCHIYQDGKGTLLVYADGKIERKETFFPKYGCEYSDENINIIVVRAYGVQIEIKKHKEIEVTPLRTRKNTIPLRTSINDFCKEFIKFSSDYVRIGIHPNPEGVMEFLIYIRTLETLEQSIEPIKVYWPKFENLCRRIDRAQRKRGIKSID